MSTPVEFRANSVLNAYQVQRTVHLSLSLPTVEYEVTIDFNDFNPGAIWITNKTVSSFIVHVSLKPSVNTDFSVYIYHDGVS